jgi:hypothetical protein
MRADFLVFSKTVSVQKTPKVRAAHAVIGFFALVELVDKLASALHLMDFVTEVLKKVCELINSMRGKPPKNEA